MGLSNLLQKESQANTGVLTARAKPSQLLKVRIGPASQQGIPVLRKDHIQA